MIYTLGNKEIYEDGFNRFSNEPSSFKKKGKTADYIGGSVFETYDLAKKYIEDNNIEGFEVYGVLADWDSDTEPNDHGEFNNLLINAVLVKVDEYG